MAESDLLHSFALRFLLPLFLEAYFGLPFFVEFVGALFDSEDTSSLLSGVPVFGLFEL